MSDGAKWRWWTFCYDRADSSRGWHRSLKLGPFIFNRWNVDNRVGYSASFAHIRFLERNERNERRST
jgi:hypothetical protein